MENKLFNALSLCQKAGKISPGFDATMASVAKGHARLVCLADDISAQTEKRVRRQIDGDCPIEKLPFTQQQMALICRKPIGVLAITDRNLAQLCKKKLCETKCEEEHI